ncbi:hypothetical protein [Alkalibacillus aidingensis]|uniref:hypothetical protein n=1 Tax=Alkalibacillus aidingensis TaxID=2747607 RepID=UPI00166133E3|nr:hypothetical protein [Alkalibacillus aidingensis]
MGFIIFLIIFPAIAVGVGVFSYLMVKKWWVVPIATWLSYVIIQLLYFLVGYGRVDLLATINEALNPYSLAIYPLFAIFIVAIIKGYKVDSVTN